MLPTYELIASQTLGSNANTVTFDSIPQNFDDLAIRVTARSTRTGTAISYMRMSFNSVTMTGHDYRQLSGNGSTTSSAAYTDDAGWIPNPPTDYTSNTFSSVEIYIPNYAGSTNKSCSVSAVTENNNTLANIFCVAGLWRSTSPITQINFWDNYPLGRQITAGSSFQIFGISNS